MQLIIIALVVGVAIVGLLPALVGFFQKVGITWISGSRGEDVFAPAAVFPGEPTPLVSTILFEVERGWTFQTILDIWGPIFPTVLFFSLIVATSVMYCAVRIFQIRRLERATFRAAARPVVAKESPRVQLRWHGILERSTSDDPQKWRNAILEADQLLNELLDMLGYKGETMADKMRKVDVVAFNTIDFAWEAHQIRNRLTQDAAFQIDSREAKRVIKLYERVFKEFKFIPEE